MITYREATAKDADSIAHLHSISWQQNYRGAFGDEFLNGPVLENRRDVWQNRLHQPVPNQYVIVAESDATIGGFSCAYSENDPVWGTLLDNLHVRKELKGLGIGSILLRSAAQWSYRKNPESGFYLWVLVQNMDAQKFYDYLEGNNQELASLKNPDGGFSACYRYVWTDVKKLL